MIHINNIQGHKGRVRICLESAEHSPGFRFFGLMNEWIKWKGWPMNSVGLLSYLHSCCKPDWIASHLRGRQIHNMVQKQPQGPLKVKKQNNIQWPNQSPGLNPKTATFAHQLPDGRQKGPLTSSEWGELQRSADRASPGMKLIWWCPWTPDDTDICCRRQCYFTAVSAYASDAMMQPLSLLKNRKQCWMRGSVILLVTRVSLTYRSCCSNRDGLWLSRAANDSTFGAADPTWESESEWGWRCRSGTGKRQAW